MSPARKRDKARETGATHVVWGVQAKRGQILRRIRRRPDRSDERWAH